MSKVWWWTRAIGAGLMLVVGTLAVVLWGIENYLLGVGLLLLYSGRDEVKQLKGASHE